jgi:hypothetical protein
MIVNTAQDLFTLFKKEIVAASARRKIMDENSGKETYFFDNSKFDTNY